NMYNVKNWIMKKFFSLAVAILLFSAIGMAQGPKGRPAKGGQKQQPAIEQMIRELDLDKSQAVKFRDAMRELEPGKGGPQGKPGKQEDLKDKRKEVDKKVKKILNKKQYKKYQKLMP
ncbi:MAG: hypothetical protein LUC88_02750, partial [Prevotella sp.]|nr:hypothetical protein [Prevotella sp.]